MRAAQDAFLAGRYGVARVVANVTSACHAFALVDFIYVDHLFDTVGDPFQS